MADELNVFRKDLDDGAKGELRRFSLLYGDVRYTYYHSEPFAPVPAEVWRFLAEEHEGIPYEKLDRAPDGASCLVWDEEYSFDAENFARICNQCCQEVWSHAQLFAPLAEIRDIVATAAGHHSWIRLIHRIVESNRVWLESIDKCLVLSPRPFEGTRKERHNPYPLQPDMFGPDDAEQRFVAELQRQNKAVPEMWRERIPVPHSVAQFHAEMLDVLYSQVQTNYIVGWIGKLMPLQRNLIASLGKQDLTTEEIVQELNNRTGKDYKAAGNIKGHLSFLVKSEIMKNVGDGYQLTDLGFRILAALS
jgi:hypothetical protein